MQILVDGNKEQAYHLILDKEQAIEILNGKRKVVITPDDPIHQRVFFKEKEFKEHCRKFEEDPNYDGSVSDIFKDVWYIHFSEYSDKWHLDVEIKDISLDVLLEEVMNIYHEDYNFHDLDEYWQENCKGLSREELPQIFCIEIDKVISHSGLN